MVRLPSEVIVGQLVVVDVQLHQLLLADHHALWPVLCCVGTILPHLVVAIGEGDVTGGNV